MGLHPDMTCGPYRLRSRRSAALLEYSARSNLFKRVYLELGGKSPCMPSSPMRLI